MFFNTLHFLSTFNFTNFQLNSVNNLTELIHKCQDEDSIAQKQLYKKYAPWLFGICLQYCKNQTDAEDNLQEGFIKIFKHIKKFRFDGSFEGWMRRIMVNTIIESFRKKKALRFEESVDDFPEVIEDQSDHHTSFNTKILLNTIEQLPPQYKLVFNLYALEGLSHQEISEILDISVGTSKSNLSRARKILKEKLAIIKSESP